MYLKSALKKITYLQGAENICGSRGISEKVSKILTSAVHGSVANVPDIIRNQNYCYHDLIILEDMINIQL